jgi:hypothetical protein
MPEPTDDLTAYADMSNSELARILLCLLVEELLRGQLAEYLSPEPVESREELLV